MYESYFGLSGPPFQLNPDPAFFYDSRGHSHALAYLKYGAHQGEGFIVVTGEIGAGKTTVVQTLLKSLDPRTIVAAQIVSTQLGSGDLLRAILIAFGVPVAGDSKAQLISTIEAFLTTLAAGGRRALLIIDEAQNLGRESIEELRMLSNFQLGNRSLIQSFLVGQPELRTVLRSTAMEQLRQRITASCHLEALDCVDTRKYIEHRLKHVGWTGAPEFTIAAYQRIHHCTGGVPRRINRLCNRLMLTAYLQEAKQVTEAIVIDTAAELRAEMGEFEPRDAPLPDTGPLSDAGRLSDAGPVTEPAPLTEAAALTEPGPVAHIGALTGVALAAQAAAGTAPAAVATARAPQPAQTSMPMSMLMPTRTSAPTAASASGPAPAAHEVELLCLCDSPSGFWKLVSLVHAMAEIDPAVPLAIVHTGGERTVGQLPGHVWPVRCRVVHLGVARGDFATVASTALPRFDALLREHASSALLVAGHSDCVLVCTLLASKRGLPIVRLDGGQRGAHEPTERGRAGAAAAGTGGSRHPRRRGGAGLRLAERNASLLDQIADDLLVRRVADAHALIREGMGSERVHFVGALPLGFLARILAQVPPAPQVLENFDLPTARFEGRYGLITWPCPPAAAARRLVVRLLPVLRVIASELPLVWPMRAAERTALIMAGVEAQLAEVGVTVVRERGYIESLGLLRHARCLVTGVHGTLSEEAGLLGMITLATGPDIDEEALGDDEGQIVVGLDPELAAGAVRAVLAQGRRSPELAGGELSAGVVSLHVVRWLQQWLGHATRSLSPKLEATE